MTVRLWVLSDLHLDVCPLDLDPPEHDIAVIAGDVSERLCDRVLPWLRGRFPGPVIYVPGNHDFYRRTYQTELAEARELARQAGIRLLAEGEWFDLWGYRFIGGTLWTDWNVRPDQRALAMSVAADRSTGMRDVRRIKNRRGPGDYSAFLPRVTAALHAEQRQRIERELGLIHVGRTVVVTHHAPHPRSLRGGDWREPLDAAYASDLSHLMEGPTAPDIWIHGHVHESRDYRVGDTRIVANPRGYVTERPGVRGRPPAREVENPAFNPSLVVEV